MFGGGCGPGRTDPRLSVPWPVAYSFPSMPVLAITANLIDRDLQKTLFKDGFTDSISKPFKPEVFYGKIFRALHKNVA